MSRARDLSRLSNPSALTVNSDGNRVGINSAIPDATLDVVGIVSATSFYGDGSNLEGVASAGLGTALGSGTDGLEVIYYTDKVLTVSDTITVDPPASTNVAYTQYSEIEVANTKDLIVADGDDLVPDILGLSTEGVVARPGAGGRIRADYYTNKAGIGAPTFQTGLNVTGVVTATSFSGSGANLTSLPAGQLSGSLPAIDGSNLTGIADVFSLTASGTISAAGKPLIINSDGTVSEITQTITGSPTAVDSFQVPNGPNDSTNFAVAYNPQKSGGRHHFFYSNDDQNRLQVTEIDIDSSGTITEGSSNVPGSSGEVSSCSATYCSYDYSSLCVYSDEGNSYYPNMVEVDSGGSTQIRQVATVSSYVNAISYDSNEGKVLIAYQDNGNGNQGQILTSDPGNSYSFGSATIFNAAANAGNYTLCYNTNDQKSILGWTKNNDSGKLRVQVASISGTSVSLGTELELTTNWTSHCAMVYAGTAQKIVIAYQYNSVGEAVVLSISGTTITAGTPVSFPNNEVGAVCKPQYMSAAYDSTNDFVVFSFADDNNSDKPTSVGAKVSGTTMTFGTPLVHHTSDGNFTATSYDSANDYVVCAFTEGPTNDYGRVVSMKSSSASTNLTDGNFVGFSTAAVGNGGSTTIDIVGKVNSGVTGLTTATKYYVQSDGTLGTSASTPSVVAGTAISGTSILVKG